MALLYKKHTEGSATIYDFTIKTRWMVLLAMTIGFVLFIASIKLSLPDNYSTPMFLISPALLLGSLGVAVVENMIFAAARMKAAKVIIIKKGVVRLEGNSEKE